MSYGGLFTPHVLLFEDRFKAAVFYVGGATTSIPPMVDGKIICLELKYLFLC